MLCVIFVSNLYLRGTMCAPPGGQNDVFSILAQATHNTTCLPKESFFLTFFFLFRNFRFQFNSFLKIQFPSIYSNILLNFYPRDFFITSKPLVKKFLFCCLLFWVKQNLIKLKPHPPATGRAPKSEHCLAIYKRLEIIH